MRFYFKYLLLSATLSSGCSSAPSLFDDGREGGPTGGGSEDGIGGGGLMDPGPGGAAIGSGGAGSTDEGTLSGGGQAADEKLPANAPPERSTTCSVISGNPKCHDVGLGTALLDVDPAASGAFVVHGGTVSVTLSADGTTAEFASTFGVDGVVVKAGPEALVCSYYPSQDGDAGLVVQVDGEPSPPHEISHLLFCQRQLSLVDGR